MADADKAKAAALKDEGNKAVAAKKPGKAAQLYTEALKYDPTNHTILSNRSGVNLELGNLTAAEEDARAAIAASPEWPKGYFRLGVALEAQQRWEEALEAYDNGLGFDAANADLLKCKERASKAQAEAEAKGAAARKEGGKPTFPEALKTAMSLVDPAKLPKVPRLIELVRERHGATLRVVAEPGKGRFLVAARPIKAYETIAVEHALCWYPPRVNSHAMLAPSTVEVRR